MSVKRVSAAACAAALTISSTTASAASIDVPVPTNLYITVAGLDWAWASPCSPSGCGGIYGPLDMSYQSTQGWRVATAADFAFAPNWTDFGSRCATAYFYDYATHCDFSATPTDGIWNMPGTPQMSYSDTWVVRGVVPVPEPATWAMTLLGFGGIGFAMRRGRRRCGALSQIA